MRKQSAASFGATLLALLASQHHNLHMALLAIGLGGSAMTVMQLYPSVRRVMLLASITMVAVSLRAARRGRAPSAIRAVTVGFAALTMGIIGWSLIRFGL